MVYISSNTESRAGEMEMSFVHADKIRKKS
jgi:hypothetical protein